MKKALLILFLAVMLSGCEKEETPVVVETASITSVTFTPATLGSISRLRIHISLYMPASVQQVKRIDLLRGGGYRLNQMVDKPTFGVNVTYDNTVDWSAVVNTVYYSVILVMADGTEIISKPYLVKN